MDELKMQKKQEKKERKCEKKMRIRELNQPPHLSVLEEIGNAVTHGVGAILAIVGLVLMLLKSDTLTKALASWVYGLSMFLMMIMSCLYHSFRYGSTVKRIFRRFDYSSIYLLIGGTFAPLLLVYCDDILGIVWFIIQWVLIITGITMVGVFGPGRLKWLHFPLYFILGWSGLYFVPSMIQSNLSLFIGILIGGLVYTLGMIPFCKRGVKSSHFIWHFFVLAGAIIHFFAIYMFVF